VLIILTLKSVRQHSTIVAIVLVTDRVYKYRVVCVYVLVK